MNQIESPQIDLAAVYNMQAAILKEFKTYKEQIEDMLADALNKKNVLTREDIAKRRDVSLVTLAKSPWLLPNFGVPDFGIGKHLWYRETNKAWEEVSMKEHELAWEALSIKEREKCLGIGERKKGKKRVRA
jgi:hypothetical protein